MRRLEFAPEAEADLLDIAAYIAADDPERALSFVDELEASCAGLSDHPESGRPRPELAVDLRSKPHGRYVIFYTPGADAVRIERILHRARCGGGVRQGRVAENIYCPQFLVERENRRWRTRGCW